MHHSELSPMSQKVMLRASAEATQLKHEATGPEHLLLGLITEIDNPAARVLANYGVTSVKTRVVVSAINRSYILTPPDVEILTEPAKIAMNKAVEIAQNEQTHTRLARPGHILLALINQRDVNVVNTFIALSVDIGEVRRALTDAVVMQDN